jgi:hypothetical protein
MFALLEHPLTVSATSIRHPTSKARRVPERLNMDAVIASTYGGRMA